MKMSLLRLPLCLLITLILWTPYVTLTNAQLPGWSGDSNLSFLLEVNGISAASSNASSPITVDPSSNVSIELTVDIGADILLRSGAFAMYYMGFPIIYQSFPLGVSLPNGTSQSLLNTSIPLGSLIGAGNLSLITGTILGIFSFNYSLQATTELSMVVDDDFVLQIGPTGPAALFSVSGLITVAFTAISIISLLLALDDFQQGILAARKMRGAERASDVGIFPRAVVLRRKRKKGKDQEQIDGEELVRRVSRSASKAWDYKRCPKCGKKWKRELEACSACGIDTSTAKSYFSSDIAEYAPKALRVVKPRSKVPVGAFCKRLKLKPDKGGALAAALTDMGVFQTRSVKVPLKKVAFSGLTLSATYWSWLQMLSGAMPSWVDILLMAAAGLVVSVLIGYCMNWLARVPRFGYD